ncbi:fibroblast growth factor receptor homolog 2-like [Culex pipiens pallens]|uniref:fibroblast growth factor receptor homolog 2-like n=1 Tax=Culex pipiens pallens TaxID=42434 RepID=UPI0022AA36EB|nr:fibroblast growth factor receptor homolog 2-like [Culex pipiens pallens]
MTSSINTFIISILSVALIILTIECEAKFDSFVEKLARGDKYSVVPGNNSKPFKEQLYRVNVTSPNLSVRLPCGAQKVYHFAHFSWTKDRHSVALKYYKNKYSLLVRNLNIADSGIYSCMICSYTTCTSSNVKLVVNSGTIMRNQTVPAGSDAVFNCFIPFADNQNYETVVYKKSAVDTEEMHFRRAKHNHTFERVTKKAEGWYTCLIRESNTGTIVINESAYLEVDDNNQNSLGTTLIIISIILILLIVIMILLSVWWFRKEPKKEYDERKIKLVTVSKKTSNDSTKGFPKPVVRVRGQTIMLERNKDNSAKVFKYRFPYDSKWELPREKLALGNMLGKGVFGKVFLATAGGLVGGGVAEVAVRMLNAEHSDEDVEDLVHELEVMKMVRSHPNIVNLLGCCSKDGPLYVIVDYAAHGNLQSFLRKHRLELEIDQDDKSVTSQNQLISYVAQIASGMEYLASINCVHRDLRARNVLVCEGYTMKITDYGRDVYNLDRFPKTSSGKVPIQWMAPESLLERLE